MESKQLKTEQKVNRLANEKSPYLLQHKYNPVDWYPWGSEAFEKAKKEDKPIFLSVGYSTCHWCHVMAHESFESEETAKIMNEYFVNIKMDREERPDIDKIYMTYVQATSGGGGWPMSVFLTPDLKPILAGTYFPPKDQYGRKGFPSVLKTIHEAWKMKRKAIEEHSNSMTESIRDSIEKTDIAEKTPEEESIDLCFKQIDSGFDDIEGGFSKAPKFPRPVIFDFLFRYGIDDEDPKDHLIAQKMSFFTLKKMSNGGMYDHIGGGYHRYSVTPDWHIPHYEKMLYDQGQILVSLSEAYQLSKDTFYLEKAKETANYVLTKLSHPEGGFYCAEDADSLPTPQAHKTVEGAFYVWSYDEIEKLIPKNDLEIFCAYFGIEKNGNAPEDADPHGELAGKNTLIVRSGAKKIAEKFQITEKKVEEIILNGKKILYEAREKRVRPHLDDKVLVAWNGNYSSLILMTSSMIILKNRIND